MTSRKLCETSTDRAQQLSGLLCVENIEAPPIHITLSSMPEFFNSSFGLKLTISQVVQEIIRFIKVEPERHYAITIGTDSDRLQGGRADFVTAVVVHRVGNGGRYFWRRTELGKLHTLRDRIIKEVLLSLEVAQKLLVLLQKEFRGEEKTKWSFEIHADIGENGETKAMMQEVLGMIRAYNFEAKTKPGSYAASNVADRHV